MQLDFYRTQLAIGVPRHKVVVRIVTSAEGQANAVTVVYRTFLRREPTFREVVRGLQSQKKSQGFGAEIDVLGSREYFQTQGGGTINGFLTALYADVLGTAIPRSAQTRLTRQLRQGVSRASVASSLVLSQPGKSAFVSFLYQQFFGTTPTTQQRARSVGTPQPRRTRRPGGLRPALLQRLLQSVRQHLLTLRTRPKHQPRGAVTIQRIVTAPLRPRLLPVSAPNHPSESLFKVSRRDVRECPGLRLDAGTSF